MRKYRIYTFSLSGHVTGPPVIVEAADDTEAIQLGAQYAYGHNVEVWEEKRLVSKLASKEGS